MNDYRFGNFIYEQRQKCGLSQKELAQKLGVTNKAVSKWENGRAKPTVNTMKKLAALFQVSIEQLLQMKEDQKPVKLHKIVITGGPCAGKTTALSWIQNAFTDLGYRILFVPETATELITGGVAPWICASNLDYQRYQVRLQLNKEEIFSEAAMQMQDEKVLIVCDRGALDNKAYMTDLEFATLVNSMHSSEVELRDNYDAVFHLVTAAKGAEEFYTTANNEARTETPLQAAALDNRLISAWTGHPHLRIIDNSASFEEKMKHLIQEISAFLGEPEPLEIERKYLIEYPDLNELEKEPNCQRVEIIQTYLKSANGEERRIRQRGMDGHYIYSLTTKRKISELKRVEVERRLGKEEYLELLMEADPSKRPIRKTRYCLSKDSRYYEIDIYPFWNNQAIVEIELADEGEPVTLPEQFKVIEEVTDNPAYKNAALAQIIGEN